MRLIVSAILVTVLLGACATPAAEPVDMASIDPNDANASLEGRISPDGTVIVCRYIKQTGTRFPLKECKSEKAWEAWDAFTEENTKTALDNIQRNRCGGVPGRC